MTGYTLQEAEKKWQTYWATHKTFFTAAEIDPSKPKYYVLSMPPYERDATLDISQLRGHIAADIVARHKRMRGFHVLYATGWDAFRLPSEPSDHTPDQDDPGLRVRPALDRQRAQLRRLGLSFDWDREIITSDPAYFKWIQWVFLQLYNKGIAYLGQGSAWFCPALDTVLTDEQVVDGKSATGGHPCVRRPLSTWMLKTTPYADRVLEGIDHLDWPLGTKEAQREAIGRSEGADVDFGVAGFPDLKLRVFTTRPDTLFGATYMVLSPEHALVDRLTTSAQHEAVSRYRDEAAKTSDLERTDVQKQKTGVFTGSFAINPVSNQQIPIWVADYVLASYGTGAIMAVPGQDERDWEFAEMFDLPIIRTVQPDDDFQGKAYLGDGPAINSGFLDGMYKDEAKRTMTRYLEERGLGEYRVNFKLRDWALGSQRSWGVPIPITYVNDQPTPVNEADLPVLSDQSTTLQSTAMSEWVSSCLLYLRHTDPNNLQQIVTHDKQTYWLPVDLYLGSAKHALQHLLFTRVWHKVLRDLGIVDAEEPFSKVVHPGEILGEEHDTKAGDPMNPTTEAVDIDSIIERYGVDALRLYEMFLGPIEQAKPWTMTGIEGPHRFLNRVWRLLVDDQGGLSRLVTQAQPSKDHLRLLHKTIKRVTEDIGALRFNTAVSGLMEFFNAFSKWDNLPVSVVESFVLILSPFAPHIAEELWQRLNHDKTLAYEPWPEAQETYLQEETIQIVVQINGKLRGNIQIPVGADKDAIIEMAKNDPSVAGHLRGKTIRREVYVPGRIVNFVVA